MKIFLDSIFVFFIFFQITAQQVFAIGFGQQLQNPTDPEERSVVRMIHNSDGVICTGVIISKHAILTAGHCVDAISSDVEILFGTGNSTRSWTETYKMNEDGNPKYDIGLVFVDDMPAANAVPAHFANNDELNQINNTQLFIGGGFDQNGHKSNLNKIAINTFTKKNPSSLKDMVLFRTADAGEKGFSCYSDSGGPLYTLINGEMHLFGVLSRGSLLPTSKDICTHKATSIGINLLDQKVKNWIASKIKIGI